MFSTAFICWKRHDLSESSQGILGKATWAEEHKKQKLEKAILSRVDFIIQWDYDWILASFSVVTPYSAIPLMSKNLPIGAFFSFDWEV